MIKISTIVEEIVRNKPFLESCIHDNLINYTSLARNIKPEIESRIKKEVQTGAIVMALKRMTLSNVAIINEDIITRKRIFGDIIVRSNLIDYTFEYSESFRKSLEKLVQITKSSPEIYFSFTQGIFESTLTCIIHT